MYVTYEALFNYTLAVAAVVGVFLTIAKKK